MMKRIVAFIITFAILMTQTVMFAAADNAPLVDSEYENAYNTLVALGFLDGAFDKTHTSTVTRGEFSDIIAYFYGSDIEVATQTTARTDKYTGYTNDVVADDWLWEGDKPDEERESNQEEPLRAGTPYYDVSADNEHYAGIKFVSQLGWMVGYDKMFRPGERITGNEVVKVLVQMMNAEFLSGNNYPYGYVQTAISLGIIGRNSGSDLSQFITYRDLVVYLYNALDSENYILIGMSSVNTETSDNDMYFEKNGKTFMENVFGIISIEGVVTSNSRTSLTKEVLAGEGNISINGIVFRNENILFDEYLGYSVKAYYTEENQHEILYVAKDRYNEETVIQADDIIGYNRPDLRYWYDDKKVKEEYIGADTLNVINGELAGDYSAEDIVPQEGYIKLLDNNGDGKNDVVFIENYSIVLTSYVDPINEVIYDKLKPERTYNLQNRKYEIKDAGGNELTLENITPLSVLTIAETSEYIRITVSFDSFKGTVKGTDFDDNEIKIEEKTYKVSKFAIMPEPKINEYYSFYLDIQGEIIAWENANKDYSYGYLIGIGENGVIDKSYIARMYLIEKSDFADFEIKEKVIFNDVRTKAENVAKSNLIVDSSDKLKSQVVMYKADEENKIIELYTADAVENKFVTVYAKNEEETVRCNGTCYYTSKPVFYATSDSRFINLPREDTDRKNGYFSLKKTTGCEITDVTHAYGRNKESMVADLLIRFSDNVQNSSVNSKSGTVAVIMETASTIKDEEICLQLTCGSRPGEANTFYINEDDVAYEFMKDCKVGDIIRFIYDTHSFNISSAEYIFRKDDMKFNENSYLWGLYGHTNPMSSEQWQPWGGETVLLHGSVQSRNDIDGIVGISPYVYEKADNDSYKVTGIDTNTTYSCMFDTANIFMYDSERNEVTAVSNNAIGTAEIMGSGSQVVTLTKWTGTYLVVIYR